MRLKDLLIRADDETLQTLVGSPVVRLLDLLDPRLTRPSKLREIVEALHAPEALLRDRSTRVALLDLLPPDDARQLAAAIGFDDSDPYGALRGASIRKGSPRERVLFEELGVLPHEEPLREGIRSESTIEPQYQLFGHQREAARSVLAHLGTTRRRVVLHMPTGAGKTRVAMNIAATILRAEEPRLVVWLAHSEELCDQAAREFELAWNCLGDRATRVYRYWADAQLEISQLRDGILIAGLAKLYERAKRDIDFVSRIGDRAAVVVMDEAHQAIAESYRFLLSHLIQRDDATGLLGLTATPGRTWNDPDKDQELASFFFRNKVTLNVPGYESPIEYLIDSGYLARPIFQSLTYTTKIKLTSAQLDELTQAYDVPRSVLELLAEDEQRNMLILSVVESLVRRHNRIIVFAASVHHARLLSTVLRSRGVRSADVTSFTLKSERSRILSQYLGRSEGPMVLCNFGVLTAGFDAPKTSAVVVARPTKSLVLYSQMIGRAIRGTKAGGSSSADIATVVDTNLPGFGDLSEAFRNWEDVWE